MIVRAHLALLLVNLFYGANYVLAKDVMPEYINPASFIMCRVLGALLLFWIVNRFTGIDKVAPRDMILMAICGLFGVCVNQLFFFEGLSLTSPVNAAIIMTSTPVIVVLLSAIVLKERFFGKRIMGILLGLMGALGVILFGAYVADTTIEASPRGDTFILINATSYALYLVLVKPLMARYSPLTVISYVFLFGCMFILPYSLDSFRAQSWIMPTDIWLKFAFVIVCVTFLAYLLNIYALKTVSPSVSSSYIYLQPLLAFLFASLHDSMTGGNLVAELSIWHLVFAIMIVSGVYLVSQRKTA